MSATVSRLPSAAKTASAKARKPVATKAERQAATSAARRSHLGGVSVMAVAAVVTGMSLSHLAHGIDQVAHVGAIDAWCTASGIDLGFLATEAAALLVVGPAAPQVRRIAKPMVAALVAVSAAMNAAAFGSGATSTPAMVVAGAIGAFVPVLVYGLTRMGFAILTGRASH